MARSDGQATAYVQEMDGPLRDVWGPINRKHAQAPVPCPEAFMATYGVPLRKVPMLASQLTGGPLRQQMWAMSPSSLGWHGWSLQS